MSDRGERGKFAAGHKPLAGAGRRKGSKNRKTLKKLATVEWILSRNKSPLAVLLEMIQGKEPLDKLKIEAIKEALPYCYPRLASIETKNDTDLSVSGTIEREFSDAVAHAEALRAAAEKAPKTTAGVERDEQEAFRLPDPELVEREPEPEPESNVEPIRRYFIPPGAA